MMEGDWTVYLSHHCIVEESAFHTRKGTSVIRVGKDNIDEFTVTEHEGVIVDDSIGGSELEMQPDLVETPGVAQKEQRIHSQIQVAEEQEPGNENAGERFTTPENKMRR